jgi:hypothetical protein
MQPIVTGQNAVAPKPLARQYDAMVIEDRASIPAWVTDLGSFRRWAASDEFPQSGDFAYLGDSV